MTLNDIEDAVGIRMTGYKRVRQELGTVNYSYRSERTNLYEPISRKIKKDLEFLSEQKEVTGSKTKKKKRVEIVHKKDLMVDLLVPSEKDTDKDTDKEPEKPEETQQTGGGSLSSRKTIRVTTVTPENKKSELVL